MNKINKTRRITDNEIFRFYTCNLTVEMTAKLCFKTPKTVLQWDKGKTIPPICKRLMKMYACRDLSPLDDDWEGWKISKGKLITPDGWPLTPNRIIMGNALIEIGAADELRFQREVLRTARMLKKLK
ncbi:Phage protein [Photobacterium malacitanum]|uniref:Phage protein n=1 Tax=Photobacterium malacitanum TaxID=2204294 RepID=A0A1Y6MDN2_9GAMM|nr:DUF3653 domain-containing protein [Photobacterium malacitanum]SMY33878.1 Phage protein [Photobacterium malacitanum]